MPLTTRNTGLVSGIPQEGSPLTTIKVLAGFYDEQSKERKAGEVIQATERFARRMIDAHRAERVAAPPATVVEKIETVEPPKEDVKEEEPAKRVRHR